MKPLPALLVFASCTAVLALQAHTPPPSDTNATNPAESLTVEQSLTADTRGSAFAELAERQKWTRAPGMLADLAMLSQDIFKAAPQDLPTTTSLLTMVGGRIVHEGEK